MEYYLLRLGGGAGVGVGMGVGVGGGGGNKFLARKLKQASRTSASRVRGDCPDSL